MDSVKDILVSIPPWFINIMSLIGFIASLITIFKYVPKICAFKRKKVYAKLVEKLKQNTQNYWFQDSPNVKKQAPLLGSFKDINNFISNNKFKISPSDYRSSLFDIFTMDMEDNNIYKCKQATIKRNYNTLIDELGKYKKYIQ